MAPSAAKRRRSAHAAAYAAKQRRQKIIVIVGCVLLVGVMAFEVPKLLHRGGSATVSAAPPPPSAAPKPKRLPKVLRSGRGVDPFAARVLSSSDPGAGPALPGRDPFAARPSQAPPETKAPALPETIVIGTPTGHGTAVHGWIVILASIPTKEGQASATSFARNARTNGVSAVGVLNSSNRRPLRGGYWVVYTGPVQTVSAAERLASRLHSSGYQAAYVRGLIEYQ
jgi:sporulation related protein